MIRTILGIFVAALFTGGLSSTLVSQEASPDIAVEPPRLTPEDRRSQWEQMRELAPDDRRARLQELRGNRTRGESQAQAEDPVGPPPENYLEQLEFRSLRSLDGVTEFGLRNPYENRTFVVSAGESRNGVEVVEFDAEQSALKLKHEGKTHTLYLQRSRVAELDVSQDEVGDQRREMWQERRERFRQFRETWQQAAEDSPELRAIEGQFRELVGDFRENRVALQNAPEGSPERERLQGQEREMREEFRLLTEYSMLEVRKNPAFESNDVEALGGMMRWMMYSGERGDGRSGGPERPR
jgi:hypothetical protein